MSEVTAEQAFAAAEVLDALDELIGVKRQRSMFGARFGNRTWPPDVSVRLGGKKAAGRELDGRTWDEYPAVAS